MCVYVFARVCVCVCMCVSGIKNTYLYKYETIITISYIENQLKYN